jgi:outer membrane protein assembly complex protein YaeT
VFFHFKTLKFTGLNSIPEKKARAYFIESGGLLSLKHNRVFSPEQLKHSAGNLTEALQRLGFQDAVVLYEPYKRNNRTGEVDVEIKVHEGPKYLVRSVREEIYLTNSPSISETRTNHPAQPYSKVWEQDFAQSIRTNYYRQGFPDTAVDLNTASREAQTNRVLLDVVAIVKTGRLIHVGDVTFTGQRRTKNQVVERRTPLHEGDLLDRTKAERGRYRLSRLGIFDSVELKYHNSDDDTRDVIYELKEGKQIDVHLLFGFGSYELLRGGVILDQYNVFGRAHHQELKLVQSFKASSADYTYTMPELFGENIDVFLNSSGLRREEISFTRFEYGGGAGIRKYFPSARTDVSTRYNYEVLRAEGADTTLTNIGLKDTTAAAIITDINHDRRDNPLYPRHGYKVFTDIEIASGYLGGDANYERVELSGSLHLPLSDSQWMHFGISHGIVAAVGDPSEDLPFNRRFFPGGENSVRGYQDGEAAPRDADGKVIGAETYLLGNAEFEQGITPKWSLVVFADAVGFAQELKNYPQDTTLVSVGGGLRWKTFIGPVRVEYGYNLNPRPRDPMGTLHFSLGFPF